MTIISALLWLVGLSGAALLLRGVVGRRVGPRDAPFCRRCRFDLSGTVREVDRGRRAAVYGEQPPAQRVCPECGAGLEQAGALRLGLRRRRWWMAGVGATVLAIVPLGYRNTRSWTNAALQHLPNPALVFLMRHGAWQDGFAAARLLRFRFDEGRLSGAEAERIATEEVRRIREAGEKGDANASAATLLLDGIMNSGGAPPPLAAAIRATQLEVTPTQIVRSLEPGEPVALELQLRGASMFYGHSLRSYVAHAREWRSPTLDGAPVERIDAPLSPARRELGEKYPDQYFQPPALRFHAPAVPGEYIFQSEVTADLFSSDPNSNRLSSLEYERGELTVRARLTVAPAPIRRRDGLPERALELLDALKIESCFYLKKMIPAPFALHLSLRAAISYSPEVEIAVRQRGRTWTVNFQGWTCKPNPAPTEDGPKFIWAGEWSGLNMRNSARPRATTYPTNPTIRPGPVDIIIIPANAETRAAMGFGEGDKAEIIISNVTPLWLESGPQPWPLTFFEPSPAPAAAPPANTIAP